MTTPETHHLFNEPIADHSFSADHHLLAATRNNNVELYRRTDHELCLTDTLRGHDKQVTGVDIAPESGRIVTCSQDRNAYVWEPSATGWKPTLVLLRLNRAATCVRWCQTEKKFAVGSGARAIAICYFEEENDWWVSKHIKKPIRSTITCLAWHPNSVILAAGSTDGHARVFSSFIKNMEEKPVANPWGERLPFNTVCGEYLNNTAGWVLSCAFSPTGNAMAFSASDSTVTIVYPGSPGQPPQAILSLSTQLLPFCSILWVSDTSIIAAGHDCESYVLDGTVSGWRIKGALGAKLSSNHGRPKDASALNMFRQMDLKGRSKTDTQLDTVHQNTITTVRPYEMRHGMIGSVTTSGVDGRVVIWTL